jgi:hypothetical protein
MILPRLIGLAAEPPQTLQLSVSVAVITKSWLCFAKVDLSLNLVYSALNPSPLQSSPDNLFGYSVKCKSGTGSLNPREYI